MGRRLAWNGFGTITLVRRWRIIGARRVGKTTLAQAFAAAECEGSIYIDFSKAPRADIDLFRNEREDVDAFLRMLQPHYAKRLPPRRCIVPSSSGG